MTIKINLAEMLQFWFTAALVLEGMNFCKLVSKLLDFRTGSVIGGKFLGD
jgi:hypothetical protein